MGRTRCKGTNPLEQETITLSLTTKIRVSDQKSVWFWLEVSHLDIDEPIRR